MNWEQAGPGTFFTPSLEPLPIRDLFLGAPVILTMRGPSLASTDLDLIRMSGIWTLGANISPCVFRPHLWIHGDQPRKFPYEIWRDPLIWKFVPLSMLRNPNQPLRKKVDGQFQILREWPADMPNVIGYRRDATFDPETLLTRDSICWGNKRRNGFPRAKSTMLSAIFLAYFLGFRRLYLVGCDCPRALSLYVKVDQLISEIRGIEIVNCTPNSGIRCLPYVPLFEAISREPLEKIDTSGW